MSTLLQMSFAGGLLIAAVAVLRLFLQKYIHRSVFLLLWFLAVVRLLVPMITPSPLSVFNLPVFSQVEEEPPIVVIAPEQEQEASSQIPEAILSSVEATVETAPPIVTLEEQREFSLWQFLFCLWAGVAVLLAAFFLLSHLRSRRRYRFSLPVPEGVAVPDGLRVRMLDGLSAPLTYGIFRPTVLLPVDFCWEDSSRLEHVLLHEQAHIRCHDVLKKHILLLTVCVHWFNPAVWLMFFLASQDMEIRSDASAVKALGKGGKLPYAQTLVAAEASRMTSLLDTGFSFSTTAKRLQALISAKYHPVISLLTAIALTLSMTGIFLTGEAAQAARPAVMLAPEEFSAETVAPIQTETRKEHHLPPRVPSPEQTQAESTTEASSAEESGSRSRIGLPNGFYKSGSIPNLMEVGSSFSIKVFSYTGTGYSSHIYSDNDAVLLTWTTGEKSEAYFMCHTYCDSNVEALQPGTANLYCAIDGKSYLLGSITVLPEEEPVTDDTVYWPNGHAYQMRTQPYPTLLAGGSSQRIDIYAAKDANIYTRDPSIAAITHVEYVIDGGRGYFVLYAEGYSPGETDLLIEFESSRYVVTTITVMGSESDSVPTESPPSSETAAPEESSVPEESTIPEESTVPTDAPTEESTQPPSQSEPPTEAPPDSSGQTDSG